MTALQVLFEILACALPVPGSDLRGDRDPAETRGWILGAAILVAVVAALLLHLLFRGSPRV